MALFDPVQGVYATGLVFARVGGVISLMPGLSSSGVPVLTRLGFALLLSLVISPVVAPLLGAIPSSVGGLLLAGAKEMIIGIMMGLVLQAPMMALNVTGETVSVQTTLSYAQTINPLLGQNGSSIATFLSMMGITLLFASNIHHLFIEGLVRSFSLFSSLKPQVVDDFAALMLKTVVGAFALGIQMAAPVMIFSLIFNISAGFVNRVMPQFQVFAIATPLILLLGLSIFTLSLGVIGLVWVDNYAALLGAFAGR